MQATDKTILSLVSVGFNRGNSPVLAGITLTIVQSEIFCLLGPSGSGKTTLLKIIAGLWEPDVGVVEILGQNQTQTAVHERDIGYVFQEPEALFPHLTVSQNVAFPLQVGRRKGRQSNINSMVNRALHAVHLSDKANKKPHQLSGGEKQRVALARAFVYEPTLLLLDEPLSSLDTITKNDLLIYIANLRTSFTTTALYVTHNQDEALQLADRLGILLQGRLRQVGTPRDVFKSPNTSSIAKITGDWNVLAVPELDRENKQTVQEHLGKIPRYVGFPIHETWLDAGQGADHLRLKTIVESTYLRNGDLYAVVNIAGQRLRARCAGIKSSLRPGQEAELGTRSNSIKEFTE